MVRLPTAATTKSVKHENTNQLNSTTIDFIAYANTLNKTANCQLKNDVENLGLLRYNNGKTISINFKQTKIHYNANLNQAQPNDTVLETSKCSSSKHQPKFYPWHLFASQYSNKMQFIAVLLCYLLAFSIQSVVARPNIDVSRDLASDWQSVAISSENKVSHFHSIRFIHFIINCVLYRKHVNAIGFMFQTD